MYRNIFFKFKCYLFVHVRTSHHFSDFIVYWFQVLDNLILRPWGETAGVEMRSRVTWVFHLLHSGPPPCRCTSQEGGRWCLPVQVHATGSCPGVVGGHPARTDKSRGSHASGIGKNKNGIFWVIGGHKVQLDILVISAQQLAVNN